MPISTRRRTLRAITLIEVMISMVLVSTILLVSLTASANLQRNSLQRRNNVLAQQLANQMLDEATSVDFQEPASDAFGLDPGEVTSDRSTFDDVDDYHLYSISPPTHRDGTAMEGYEGWTVSIAVASAVPSSTGIDTINSDITSPLRIIEVTCTSPDGSSVAKSAMVSDVPSNVSSTSSIEKWRRVKLTFPDREINVTAPLRNQPDSI